MKKLTFAILIFLAGCTPVLFRGSPWYAVVEDKEESFDGRSAVYRVKLYEGRQAVGIWKGTKPLTWHDEGDTLLMREVPGWKPGMEEVP